MDSSNDLSFSSKPWPPPEPPPPGGPKDRHKRPKQKNQPFYEVVIPRERNIPIFLCHPVFVHYFCHPSVRRRPTSTPRPSFVGVVMVEARAGMYSGHVPLVDIPRAPRWLSSSFSPSLCLQWHGASGNCQANHHTSLPSSFDSTLAIPVHVPPPPLSPADIITPRAPDSRNCFYRNLQYSDISLATNVAKRQGCLSVCLPLPSLYRVSNHPPGHQSSLRDQSTQTVSSQDRPSHPFPSCCRRRQGWFIACAIMRGYQKNICCAKKMQVRRRLHRTNPPIPSSACCIAPFIPRAPMPFAPLPFASIPSDGEKRRV